jgi:hypothetical protein
VTAQQPRTVRLIAAPLKRRADFQAGGQSPGRQPGTDAVDAVEDCNSMFGSRQFTEPLARGLVG